MGKYKIGARVRDADGDEGVIVGKSKGERLVRYGEDLLGIEVWVTKSFITPLAPSEQQRGEIPASEPDWKPRVGDRVQFKENGAPATLRVDDCGRLLIEFDERQSFGHNSYPPHDATLERTGCAWWVYADQIEPLPVAAEAQGAGDAPADDKWDAKPRDRVKVVQHKWADAPVGSLGTVRDVKGYGVTATIDGGDGFAWFFHWGDVQFQPLTIEAGKFYLTRDGRKVGPVYLNNYGSGTGPFSAEVDGCDWCFDLDGKLSNLGKHDYDLVAEWDDEPAAQTDNPVAVAPATATPAFKVGDRVRVKPKKGTVLLEENGLYTIERVADGGVWVQLGIVNGTDFGLASYEPDRFDLVTPITPPITTGSLVTLASPAIVTGVDRSHAHLQLASGGAYTLPVAALVAAS